MSSILTLKASDVRRAFSALTPLFPKGSSNMSVGLHLSKGHLKVVCLQGVVYQADIPVDDELAIADATIIYYNITPLLPSIDNVYMEFTPMSVRLFGDDFETEFQLGYSVVEVQDFSKLVFSNIISNVYADGFSTIQHLGLEKLYNLPSPVIVMKDVAIQKYPNTWVQVRTSGLPFDATLDITHVNLLLKFAPKEVCTSIPNTLVFKNANALLQIPYKRNVDNNNILSLMQDLGEPITINIKRYLEKLKSMARVDTHSKCKISLFADGMKSTINYENTSISVSTGNCYGEAIKVCHLPMRMWLNYLNNIGAENIQILVGGDKLCLRTQSTIIITHALL